MIQRDLILRFPYYPIISFIKFDSNHVMYYYFDSKRNSSFPTKRFIPVSLNKIPMIFIDRNIRTSLERYLLHKLNFMQYLVVFCDLLRKRNIVPTSKYKLHRSFRNIVAIMIK